MEVSQSVDFWKGEYFEREAMEETGSFEVNDAILLVEQSFREGGMELELESRVLTGVRKPFSKRRWVREVRGQKVRQRGC